MTDLHDPDSRRQWDDWVAAACATVGVDPTLVDIDEIHRLTKQVAHRFDRPMAPVSSFILGVALAHGGDAREVRRRIESTLPDPRAAQAD